LDKPLSLLLCPEALYWTGLQVLAISEGMTKRFGSCSASSNSKKVLLTFQMETTTTTKGAELVPALAELARDAVEIDLHRLASALAVHVVVGDLSRGVGVGPAITMRNQALNFDELSPHQT
jgi:hypothetical protein